MSEVKQGEKMKNSIKSILAAVACIGFVGLAHAEEAGTPASHDQHRPEGQTADTKKDQMGSDMMGGQMNMDGMHAMMGECMKMHNDGKMCNHDMMNKCQEKMGKDDCKKMMKQMKKQDKSDKKK